MLFNSYSFLFLFAPLFYPLFWALPRLEARKWLSLVASYVFYGAWSVKFAALMLLTTSVDYFTAQRLEDAPTAAGRRLWLGVSMACNLGVLAVFKYYDFFADSLNALLPQPLLPLLRLALPIGISFYTFESMSYTIDVYRGHVPAVRRFVDYGSFVTMFPRLVAGPIARYGEVHDQLVRLPRVLPGRHALLALHFFAIGLAKKVFVADPIAVRYVDPFFAHPGSLDLAAGWVAALGYTAQLYFDFSGYSDMAVGLGHAMGITLPRNFNRPYASLDLSDFWRRWHISLSSWLRDYLYISLGGNRGGDVARLRNLFLTMLLGGLWHGANWTFLVWGAYHGLGLVIHHTFRSRGGRMPAPAAWLVTFLTVVVGWVFFRAASVRDALSVLAAMVGAHGLDRARAGSLLGPLAGIILSCALAARLDTYDIPTPRRTWAALALGTLLALGLSRLGIPSPFLYFQF